MDTLFKRLQAIVEHGWSVFPVVAGDKIPAIAGGFRSAQFGQAGYALFRGRGDDTNIGIALGSSGLLAIDIEVSEHDWVERLPSTWTQRTPSGGWHFVFRQPAGMPPIPNVPLSVGLADSVEIRGDGGYIVGPGSYIEKTKTGEPGWYELVNDVPPVEVPGWVLERIEECKAKAKAITKPKLAVVRSTGSGEGWRRRIDDLVMTLQSAGEGTRNDTLIRVASSVGRVVAGGFLSESEACGILGDAIAHWPSPKKNEDCIRRGIGYGMTSEAWYPDITEDPLGDDVVAMILEATEMAETRTVEAKAEPVGDMDAEREELAERVGALSDVAGEFIQLARDCSVYWQPGFAVGGAVALGSVLGSRRLVWPSQSPLTSSLYCLIIGGSGQGKSTAKDPVMRCLAEWPELIGASKMGPSVQSNIASIKAASESGHGQLWMLDEWHDTLEGMLSRKASTFTSENKGLLLEMATMNTGTYRRRRSLAESKDGVTHDVIHVPGFCLMALSATEPLMRVLGQASVDNGLVPRHIAFGPQSSLPQKIRSRRAVGTPDLLRSAIIEAAKIHKAWATACNGLALWQGVDIQVDDDARDIIEDFGDAVDCQRRARKVGIPDAILARAEEHAIRVSMSLACLSQAGVPVPRIDKTIADLACDIVSSSMNELGSALRDHGGETDYERGMNKIKRTIESKAGVDGWVSWSAILSSCRWADSRTLTGMVAHLVASGDVEATESGTTKKALLYRLR